ncbi:MAG: cytochrome b/b6 domain-containing protein [Ramlibacter sp.]
MSEGSSPMIRIWDLPTRLFHWALALAAIALLATGKIGGDAMQWHARLGYCVGALVLFRIAWGFAGGHWSRFTTFPPSPRRAWRYAQGGPATCAGHNPMGALSVYAMLLFFLAQVASGLFSETKEDFAGPLNSLVSHATSHWLTGYHKNVGQWILIALVLLHLAAIAFYAWRGRNLVAAMVHGDQAADGPPSRDDAGARVRALALLALAAFAMWGVVRLGG